jgi:hypothetical protein
MEGNNIYGGKGHSQTHYGPQRRHPRESSEMPVNCSNPIKAPSPGRIFVVTRETVGDLLRGSPRVQKRNKTRIRSGAGPNIDQGGGSRRLGVCVLELLRVRQSAWTP